MQKERCLDNDLSAACVGLRENMFDFTSHHVFPSLVTALNQLSATPTRSLSNLITPRSSSRLRWQPVPREVLQRQPSAWCKLGVQLYFNLLKLGVGKVLHIRLQWWNI